MSSGDSSTGLESVVISPEMSITQALVRLDQAGTGALVLCAPGKTLYGVLTDGDVRRAILRGVSLDEQCGTIANRHPITAQSAISTRDAMHLMTLHDINHLPLVNEEGEVQGFRLRKDLVAEQDLEEAATRRLQSVMIRPDLPLIKTISRLDQAGTGALALCTEGRKLFGLITDGDIRRAILHGVSLDDPCGTIANRTPVVARGSISSRGALRVMTQHGIDHLPVLDGQGQLVELLLRRDLIHESQIDLMAVVMAGGYGTRLLPLTEHTPKPMLPVGDRPLMERTIQQLRRSGIREVHLATHYMADAIIDHFGDGEAYGVHLAYSNEDQPLGTAGGLKSVRATSGPFVVINGDILTGVSFQDMLLYHRKHGALLTMGVRRYGLDVPFGVVECDDVWVRELREKPSLTLFINAGIYLLEPTARDYIPEGVRFDMTDLIKTLLDQGQKVASFPIIEYWQDVGRHQDYDQAQEDARTGRI